MFKLRKHNIYAYIVFVVIVLLIFEGTMKIGQYKFEVENSIHEAKNVEFALRLLSYEYYGEDRLIYSHLTLDGLAEGVWEEVKELSGAEGELILGSWDDVRRSPKSFTYIKNNLVVIYHYDEKEENCWDVYYHIKQVKALR